MGRIKANSSDQYYQAETDFSLVEFDYQVPYLRYHVKEQKTGSKNQNEDLEILEGDSFVVAFDSLDEINHIPTNLGYDSVLSINLEEQRYLMSHSNPSSGYRTETDQPISQYVNYTLENGSGKFVFQVFYENYTLVNPVTLTEQYINQGSVKFSMFLLGWPFSSEENTLRLKATINVSDSKGMKYCSVDSFDGSSKEVGSLKLECKTTTLRGTLILQNTALVIQNPLDLSQLIEIPADIYVFAKDYHNQTYLISPQGKYPPDFSYSSSDYYQEDYCKDSDDNSLNSIKEIEVWLEFRAFVGSLIYDPQLSVLLGSSNDGNGNGCASSSVDIIHNTIFWLSVSAFVIACILSVIVMFLSRIRKFSVFLLGKEGTRIHNMRSSEGCVEARFSQRRSQRNSEAFGESQCYSSQV